jgi:hypothetical protein
MSQSPGEKCHGNNNPGPVLSYRQSNLPPGRQAFPRKEVILQKAIETYQVMLSSWDRILYRGVMRRSLM